MEIDSKSAIRNRYLNLLRSQKEEDQLLKSRKIREKLLRMPEFIKAATVLCYASFDGEVDTFGIMKQALKLGKKIALPKIFENKKQIIPMAIQDLENDLTKGPYGIHQPKKDRAQPISLDCIDLALIPGVVFDSKCNRLGRGQGYYDRFLKKLPSGVPTVGLAFDFQIVEALPVNKKHDIPVSRVLTN